jgi:hypothetical protein
LHILLPGGKGKKNLNAPDEGRSGGIRACATPGIPNAGRATEFDISM